MSFDKKVLLFFSVLFIFCNLWAAPHPGTATSVITDPSRNEFFLTFPFTIKNLTSHFTLNSQVEKDSPQKVLMLTSLSKNNFSKFHVQVEELEAPLKTNTEVKKWVREYAGFGFEILGFKNINVKNHDVYVIDFLENTKKVQLRQVLFLEGKTSKRMALFSCLDKIDSFNKQFPHDKMNTSTSGHGTPISSKKLSGSSTAQLCDVLVQNFEWKK